MLRIHKSCMKMVLFTLKKGSPMGFIDMIWRKQNILELKLAYFVFFRIKTKFLFGLIAFSLFVYAFVVGYIFVVFKKENLFTTGVIPVPLNPVLVSFIAFCILFVMFLDQSQKI